MSEERKKAQTISEAREMYGTYLNPLMLGYVTSLLVLILAGYGVASFSGWWRLILGVGTVAIIVTKFVAFGTFRDRVVGAFEDLERIARELEGKERLRSEFLAVFHPSQETVEAELASIARDMRSVHEQMKQLYAGGVPVPDVPEPSVATAMSVRFDNERLRLREKLRSLTAEFEHAQLLAHAMAYNVPGRWSEYADFPINSQTLDEARREQRQPEPSGPQHAD